MRRASLLLPLLCIACLCACIKQPPSQNNKDTPPQVSDPDQAPLTAHELAQLLGVHYWRFPARSKSDKPYWGVQVVARNADSSVVATSPAVPFLPKALGFPFRTSGPPKSSYRVLLGIQETEDEFTGRLMTSGSSAHFKFARSPRKGGQLINNLVEWHDDKAEFVLCLDEKQEREFSISVELLREKPP